MDADNCSTVGGRCDSKRKTAKTDDDLSESGSIALLGADFVPGAMQA